MSSSALFHGWLTGIVLLAFGLRLILVHYGLPLLLYEDEPIYYDHALNFGLGHWQIGYFKKPSFFLYFYSFTYYLAYLVSPWMTWQSYVQAFWENPGWVATVGRTVSVLFATGSVWLLGQIGRRAFSWPVGLLAAFFLAVDVTHLRTSPIVISDIPALFFILAAAWFALKISETARWADYWRCAVVIALATSFKYNIFSVCFLLMGHGAYYFRRAWGTRDRIGARWAGCCREALQRPAFWASLALIPVVFLAINPMILLDFPTFLAHLNLEKRHMLLRHSESTSEHWQPLVAFGPVFFRIFPRNPGWLMYGSGLAGMVVAWLRYRRPTVVLLAFPMAFLLVLLQFRIVNAKYLMPLFPFWYLMAAVFWVALWQGIGRWTKWQSGWQSVLVAVLAAMALASPNIAESLQHVRWSHQPDTRNEAYEAIGRMAQPGDRFLLAPDTLTLDNRLFRSQWVKARFAQGRFGAQGLAGREGEPLQDLQTFAPRYVLLDLGLAKRQRSAQGPVTYQFPYTAAALQTLRQHYEIAQWFSPFELRLSVQTANRIFQVEGLETLCAQFLEGRSPRRQLGPVLLLLKQKTTPESPAPASE